MAEQVSTTVVANCVECRQRESKSSGISATPTSGHLGGLSVVVISAIYAVVSLIAAIPVAKLIPVRVQHPRCCRLSDRKERSAVSFGVSSGVPS